VHEGEPEGYQGLQLEGVVAADLLESLGSWYFVEGNAAVHCYYKGSRYVWEG